jgi:hypothetical protein
LDFRLRISDLKDKTRAAQSEASPSEMNRYYSGLSPSDTFTGFTAQK